jgi:peptidoglycan/LPS O-acetylase OafA/YrhL
LLGDGGRAVLSRALPIGVRLATQHTILDRMRSAGPATTGFDYLRIGLATAVLAWHSIILSTGSTPLDQALWSGPFRFLPAAILPMFFALSGFLVSASLERTRLHHFLTLRLLRIVPALAVVVVLSALVLGPVFTTLPLPQYFASPEFGGFFLNIVAIVHVTLPGVFEHNPDPRFIASQLWTIPFEFQCYVALAILSLLNLLRDRRALAQIIVLSALVATVCALLLSPVSPFDHVPGPVLVLCFLAAVSLYQYRDAIPCSPRLAVASAIASAALLELPNASYLAAFPVAYLTVSLGLLNPPRIPFGDLSYGVYLLHFPIEQTIMHLFPGAGSWWRLTLMALPPTFVCAWLSWNLVEHPILSRKPRILGALDRAMAAAEATIRPFAPRRVRQAADQPRAIAPGE